MKMHFTGIETGVFSGIFSQFRSEYYSMIQGFAMDYPSPYYVEVENLTLSIRADASIFYVNSGYGLPALSDIDRSGV